MKYEKKMDFPVIITIIGAVLLIVSFLLAQMQKPRFYLRNDFGAVGICHAGIPQAHQKAN